MASLSNFRISDANFQPPLTGSANGPLRDLSGGADSTSIFELFAMATTVRQHHNGRTGRELVLLADNGAALIEGAANVGVALFFIFSFRATAAGCNMVLWAERALAAGSTVDALSLGNFTKIPCGSGGPLPQLGSAAQMRDSVAKQGADRLRFAHPPYFNLHCAKKLLDGGLPRWKDESTHENCP